MKLELRQLFIPRVSNWRTLTRGTCEIFVRLLLTELYMICWHNRQDIFANKLYKRCYVLVFWVANVKIKQKLKIILFLFG